MHVWYTVKINIIYSTSLRKFNSFINIYIFFVGVYVIRNLWTILLDWEVNFKYKSTVAWLDAGRRPCHLSMIEFLYFFNIYSRFHLTGKRYYGFIFIFFHLGQLLYKLSKLFQKYFKKNIKSSFDWIIWVIGYMGMSIKAIQPRLNF